MKTLIPILLLCLGTAIGCKKDRCIIKSKLFNKIKSIELFDSNGTSLGITEFYYDSVSGFLTQMRDNNQTVNFDSINPTLHRIESILENDTFVYLIQTDNQRNITHIEYDNFRDPDETINFSYYYTYSRLDSIRYPDSYLANVYSSCSPTLTAIDRIFKNIRLDKFNYTYSGINNYRSIFEYYFDACEPKLDTAYTSMTYFSGSYNFVLPIHSIVYPEFMQRGEPASGNFSPFIISILELNNIFTGTGIQNKLLKHKTFTSKYAPYLELDINYEFYSDGKVSKSIINQNIAGHIYKFNYQFRYYN